MMSKRNKKIKTQHKAVEKIVQSEKDKVIENRMIKEKQIKHIETKENIVKTEKGRKIYSLTDRLLHLIFLLFFASATLSLSYFCCFALFPSPVDVIYHSFTVLYPTIPIAFARLFSIINLFFFIHYFLSFSSIFASVSSSSSLIVDSRTFHKHKSFYAPGIHLRA